MDFIIQNFQEFLTYTGFANATAGNLIMILVGIVCIWLAIKKDFEPLLLGLSREAAHAFVADFERFFHAGYETIMSPQPS